VTRTGLVAYPILQDRGLLRLSSREAAQKPPQEGHWLALSVRRVRALAEFHPDSRVISIKRVDDDVCRAYRRNRRSDCPAARPFAFVKVRLRTAISVPPLLFGAPVLHIRALAIAVSLDPLLDG
jgi:hypothetical protein